MPEKTMEEETYSLIFSSLKHPIRRKILRMLTHNPLAFSEMLNALSMDSGHLSYHLDQLDELVSHTNNGKYTLSSIGIAAVKLMHGVEDYSPPPSPSSSTGVFDVLAKTSIIGIILALLAASLFLTGFIQPAGGESSEIPDIAVTIPPNQTYTYNLTIIYNEDGPWLERVTNVAYLRERPPLLNTLTLWEEGAFAFSFTFLQETFATQMRIYDAAGTVMDERGEQGHGGTRASFGTWAITQSGTYRMEIENTGAHVLTGSIGLHITWDRYMKPYYGYGIAGLILVSLYPTLMVVKQILSKAS